MLTHRVALLAAFVVVAALESQPFDSDETQHHDRLPPPDIRAENGRSHHEFAWKIRRVAVIGAGVTDLLQYQALKSSPQFETVRVFERDSVPGGNWHYTEDEIAQQVPVRELTRAEWWKADYIPSRKPETLPARQQYDARGNATERARLARERLAQRVPKAIWKTLEANTPSVQQQIPGFPWSPSAHFASTQVHVSRYLRSFAAWLGMGSEDANPDFAYNTRVESVHKRYNNHNVHQGWTLLLRKFVKITEDIYEEELWEEDFDAVVVASGRFSVPNIPNIPGLAEWQDRFPDRIIHGREYRLPGPFSGQNVLVVGAGPTASEISCDINPVVSTSYLSIRPASDSNRPLRRFHLSRVPNNTSFIGEIKRFLSLAPHGSIASGRIELTNGTVLTGIDTLIFGTGYRYAFPFLSQYHHDARLADRDSPVPHVEEQPIISDGSCARSLWRDIIYIDQPTLAFANLNVGIQTFVYGKYIGRYIAEVWSGRVQIPRQERMWKEFWETVHRRGGLKSGYLWLDGGGQKRSFKSFISEINRAALKHGGEQIEVQPDTSEFMDYWVKARYAEAGNMYSPDFVGSGQIGGEPSELNWSSAEADDW